MEKELVALCQELYSLESDINKWNIKNFENSPPRLIRLQRINSILKAMYLSQENNMLIESFVNGKLIEFEKIKLDELFEILNKSSLNTTTYFLKKCTLELELASMFSWLLNYSFKLFDLISIHKNVLASTGLFTLGLSISYEISNNIKNDLDDLNRILFYIINPTRKKVSHEILIEFYNYPADNLQEIDINWL